MKEDAMKNTFVVFAMLLGIASASAQTQPEAAYWQRLIAQKEAQSSQQIVDLAKALDAANKQIDELKKQLNEQAKKK